MKLSDRKELMKLLFYVLLTCIALLIGYGIYEFYQLGAIKKQTVGSIAVASLGSLLLLKKLAENAWKKD